MKPYGLQVIEWPDVADIKFMGAKSSVGKLGHGRGYSSGNSKANARRYWKRKARKTGTQDISERRADMNH